MHKVFTWAIHLATVNVNAVFILPYAQATNVDMIAFAQGRTKKVGAVTRGCVGALR